MKKTIKIFVLAALLSLTGCAHYKVYSVRENPSLPVGGGVVYALPKTLIRVDVTVERRNLKSAPYRDYATEMLGVATQLVDSSYRITDIELFPTNVADPDQFYFVKINRGSVAVNDKHLLLAIGMQPDSAKQQARPSRQMETEPALPVKAEYNLYERADTFYTRHDRPGRPSLVSTRKDSRSIKQRAQAAAERLDEIQSKKNELIEGNYDGAYSAEAVRYLYEQLCRQEESTIADFCGSVQRETVSFYVEPRIKKNAEFLDTIIWFSPAEGFIGTADDTPGDAFPLVCQVLSDNNLRSAGRFLKYHTSGAGSNGSASSNSQNGKSFRYRVPEQAEVTVYASEFSVRRRLPLSQLGPTVSLPKRRVKALFDPITFDLKHLER